MRDWGVCAWLRCHAWLKSRTPPPVWLASRRTHLTGWLHYRPHTKYGGRYCFHRHVSVILSIGGSPSWGGGGGYLVWELDFWSGGVCPEGGCLRPPSEMATAAVVTHPTGMHSCYYIVLSPCFRTITTSLLFDWSLIEIQFINAEAWVRIEFGRSGIGKRIDL